MWMSDDFTSYASSIRQFTKLTIEPPAPFLISNSNFCRLDIIASADDSASSILKLYYKPVLNTKCPLSLKRTFCIYFIALPDLPELSPIHNLCPFRIYQGFLPY